MPLRADDAMTPQLASLRALIAKQRQDDPLVGAKVGSKLALDMLLDQLTTEHGVHAESLMAISGVLVGLSVQASLWEEAQRLGQRRIPGVQRVTCGDNSQVWIGEPITKRMMAGYGSPWQLLREAARQEGCPSLPEGEQLVLDSVQRIGTPSFGHPAVPASHTPQVLAADEQIGLWRLYLPLCLACCDKTEEWPLLFGLLASRALKLVKPTLSADLAIRLAMDSALDAAKVPHFGADAAGGD